MRWQDRRYGIMARFGALRGLGLLSKKLSGPPNWTKFGEPERQ